MFRTPLTADHVRNNKVLRRIGTTGKLLLTIGNIWRRRKDRRN